MATPYTSFQNSFHSRIVSEFEIFESLELQYFFSALGDFELELYPLTYSEIQMDDGTDTMITVGQIEQTLSRSEINLIGALMYKYHLARKIDEVLQLQNIVGKDIALTGVGQSKQEYNRKYESLLSEITNLMHGLKDNTYGN